jgi:hypothetical protein
VITRFLTDSVLLERRTGSDDFNGNTYSPGVFVRARLHQEAVVVRTFDNREITSNAHVSTRDVVSPGDRVTDAYGVAREVVTVRTNKDTKGVFSHFVGYLA